VFASYGDADAARLEWVRIDRTDDAMTFWMPDSSRFVDLVRSGRLPGTIDEDDERVRNVTLFDLGPEHLDLITSGAEGMLFEWEEPGFLLRVSNEVGRPYP
jgi:hypothetical protein